MKRYCAAALVFEALLVPPALGWPDPINSSRGEAGTFRASAHSVGSSTGGIQEAVNACDVGTTADECRIVVDQNVTPTTTVTIGSLTGATKYGITIDCLAAASPNVTDPAGTAITWGGAAGGTMFRVYGVYGFRVNNCGIKARNAGIAWDIVGNNIASGGFQGRPTHNVVFDNVLVRGDAGSSVIAYYVRGNDADGSDESGTATAGAPATLTDGSKSWTVNQWQNKCGSGADACFVFLTGGTGMGQIAKVTSNNATVLSTDTTWVVQPDSTTTYKIQAVVNTHSDTEFNDQADFIQWRGGGAVNVGECIRIASTQSLHNAANVFECANYSSPFGGYVVLAGNLDVVDAYAGTTASRAGAGFHALGQSSAGTIGPLYLAVRHSHFEMGGDISHGIVSEVFGSDSTYPISVEGNDILIQHDGLTALKLANNGPATVQGNRFRTNHSGYATTIAITHAAPWARDTWLSNLVSNFGGGVTVTLTNNNIWAPVGVATGTCAGGAFNDITDLDGVKDAGDPCL